MFSSYSLYRCDRPPLIRLTSRGQPADLAIPSSPAEMRVAYPFASSVRVVRRPLRLVSPVARRDTIVHMSQRGVVPPATRPSTEPSHAWIVIIVALGAVLRLYPIWFGLPDLPGRPDEATAVMQALRINGGDFDPHFFHWPSLTFYVFAGVFAAFS